MKQPSKALLNLRLFGLVLCGFLLSSCSQESETFHENGQLETRGNYKEGKEDGLFESYHPNGQLRQRTTIKDGESHGLFESYHENGQLESRGTFKDGELDGLFETFYENGQLETRGNLKNKEPDGLFESFRYNGQPLRLRTYKEGKIIVSEHYDKNNQKITNGVLENHYPNG